MITSLPVYNLAKVKIAELIQKDGGGARHMKATFSLNEVEEFTFQFPMNNEKAKYLVNENMILYNDEFYLIKTVRKARTEDNEKYYEVTCKHLSDRLSSALMSMPEIEPLTVIDLMKVALQYDDQGISRTGWTIGSVTVNKTVMRGLEASESSPYSILLTIADKYEGYLKFNSRTQTVDLFPRDGIDVPVVELRVRKNLKGIEINYDTTEMYTRLYLEGCEDDFGNPIDVIDVNPTGMPYVDNYQWFLAQGYTQDYIDEHPDMFVMTNKFVDDTIYDPQDLYDTGLKELEKVSKPTIEVTITGLDINDKYANRMKNCKVGDCVRIVDTELGLDFLCNVTSREIDYDEEHILNIEVSNHIEYTDLLHDLFNSSNTVNSVTSSGGNINGTHIDDLIKGINLSGETLKIIADKFQLEGLITANGNFTVQLDGSITAKNATFSGNITGSTITGSTINGGNINVETDVRIGNILYLGKDGDTTTYRYISLNGGRIIENSDASYDCIAYRSGQIAITSSMINLATTGGVGVAGISVQNDPYGATAYMGGQGDATVSSSQGTARLYAYIGQALVKSERGSVRFEASSYITANLPIGTSSDIRLKNNISELDASWIDELNVKTFKYNNSEHDEVGLIANEYIDKEFSKYFLNVDEKGFYSVRYQNITNALIKYCQQSRKQIENLNAEIALIKAQLGKEENNG